MPRKKYNVGDKVGRLFVLEEVGRDHANKLLIKCRCDCLKEVVIRLNNLGRKTHSCGCERAELIRSRLGLSIMQKAAVNIKWSCHRHHPTSLTTEQVKALIFADRCHYCNRTRDIAGILWMRKDSVKEYGHDPLSLSHESVMRFGIDRVDSSKGYQLDNCVTCCIECNHIKREHSLEKLMVILPSMLERIKKMVEAK